MSDPATISASGELPLDLADDGPAPGAINPACSFYDHGGQRFIQIHGVHLFAYHLEDRVTESMVWIAIFRARYAKLTEIAQYTDLSLRSLERWNAVVKKEGYQGLAPKPKSGRPRTISETDRALAVMLLESDHPPKQIIKQLNISPSSLRRIHQQHNESPTEQWFDFGDDQQEETPTPVDDAEDYHTPRADSPNPVIDHPGPQNDPDDRSYHRDLAKLGLHEDATPLFATERRIENLGFLMFVALLGQTQVLDIFANIYGKTLGPAFYGLRTMVMTILMMLVLRIKRPENLRQHNPQNLAKPLGLDRVMEVKTLRRKLSTVADKNQGINLMEQLGEDRLERRPAPADGQLNTLYIDGHVNCYCGGFKTGQTWSATKNRVVKGKTNTWLNLPDQTPLIYLESPFNEGLVKMLEENIGRIEEIYGEKPVLTFDREGWDVDFLYKLDKAGWNFITYRKGAYADLAVEEFTEIETNIGKRSYAHVPVDIDQSYNHYQTETDKNGKQSRKKTGQVSFREIRVLSDDKGHQTAIVTNIEKAVVPAVVVCATLFERWGNQENVFKYMIAEYGLDDLWEYNRDDRRGNDSRKSEEEIPDDIDHPNPDYTKLTRQISVKTGKRNKILARHGLALEAKTDDPSGEISAEEIANLVKQIRSGKDAAELKKLNRELIDLRVAREALPKRERVSPAGYKQLRRGVSHVVDSLKMVAYEIETRLFEMLEPHYPNQAKEGRKLIVAALATAGQLRIEAGRLIVCLEAQSSPKRTEAIDQVCRELTALGTVYPGTDLRIEFDTARD